MRAYEILVQCGRVKPGGPTVPRAGAATRPIAGGIFAPLYGGHDVNTISGPEIYPKVTQSESVVWGNGSTVVVNYNDSMTSPDCYAGLSYSTNGGATFTRVLPSPLCSGHSTNYGDPVLVWNARLGSIRKLV